MKLSRDLIGEGALILRIPNGFVEAMNGLIQAAKARAHGYRTDRCLMTISYLICGKLKHLPANPWIPSSV
ncbi:MAG: hypothetical protein ACYCPE_10785 [Metallibacterium sp.]